jgi:hypothetical protein
MKPAWSKVDAAEVRFILLELIGKPGQYNDRDANPYTFYLPLAGPSCRLKLTFSNTKELVAIEPGPAFDPGQWAEVVEEIEGRGGRRIGRDCSFSSHRVNGSWRGKRSGIQILPPPADAPQSVFEMAEHPFILEYPLTASKFWPITNFRRMREHRRLTFLLNVLLAGHTTMQPRRSKHLWAIVNGDGSNPEVKWVQEFYYTNLGDAVQDELSCHPTYSLTKLT